MTALAWALAGIIATQLGALLWLVYGRSADARALQVMDDERDKAVQESASLKFELANAKKALEKETDRADTFEGALADVQVAHNLPAGDVRSRVRIAAAQTLARRKNGVPGSEADAVHPPPATGSAAAAEVPRVEGRDPDGVMRPD